MHYLKVSIKTLDTSNLKLDTVSAMHAYLLVGQGITNYQLSITNLAAKLNAKIMEYPLQKIEDVRNLNNLIRLTFSEPTLIVLKNIHEATEEALNAFLKNLEEPQENIYFALTAPSVRKVLPTIVSRCQVIRIMNHELGIKNQNQEEIEKFLDMAPAEKISYIDTLRDREKALEFAENTVFLLHSKLHSNNVKYGAVAKNLECANKLVTCLKRNGNVNLQLTNFVVNYQNA